LYPGTEETGVKYLQPEATVGICCKLPANQELLKRSNEMDMTAHMIRMVARVGHHFSAIVLQQIISWVGSMGPSDFHLFGLPEEAREWQMIDNT
jgi:hypothetical protein